MGKSRKKGKKIKKESKRNKLILLAVVPVAILIVVLFANIDYSFIDDQYKANGFKPSPEIEALVSKMNLTDKAKTILYASSPQLKDKVAFNGTCGHDGDPSTYIAGCYYVINEEEYIDIYNSGKDASELQNSYYNYTNSQIVTLAHEMMHAVYSRIPDNDKEWIEVELNKIYSNNSNIRSKLSKYPSSQKFDELYVRVATEVYGIPNNLEKHYALYFKDRQYIAKLYHDNEEQLNIVLQEADKILEKIKKQDIVVQNSYGYYARRDAINEYNRLVDLYNSQIGVYRDILAKKDSEK